ncbi:MAG: AraC family transcriptional regulator [Candidatus Dormibacteraeota bacterium]|uniref:AraC family transcriptional regulator n=1 Tax=Candidatus Dormiibacter inghamiae TaxID=3127013 RepID=A0A934KKG0_9BACT|nr:AraC family transcriptional regulator [Candidatus Dormibacteraeota bacterium]MBJ7607287.1 AraC family transcriptional regulator [Candidatus Dormibacteraeota bacterium]
MDVLSDVLNTIRLESSVFAELRLNPPWGIRSGARDDFAFHVISRGQCLLEVEGSAPLYVQAGEVVVLAPGYSHSLRDRPDSPTLELDDLVAGTLPTQAPGRHAAAHLICGCFRFRDLRPSLLASSLPNVIHARDAGGEVGAWLAQTLRLLSYESQSDRPGKSTVVNRLCDALFVYILRSHLADLPAEDASWLRGLAEARVGTALELMHEAPARQWTLAELASRVGLSRSAFAVRFRSTVGDTPIQYLTKWRLERAAAMLRDGAVVEQVAAAAGYESAAGFSKAFKRHLSVPPGAYRRADH